MKAAQDSDNFDHWYVAFDGVNDAEPDRIPFAFALPDAGDPENRAAVHQAYADHLSGSISSINRGVYFAELTGVKPEQQEDLEDEDRVAELAKAGFPGYTVNVLEKVRADFSEWLPEALEDADGGLQDGELSHS